MSRILHDDDDDFGINFFWGTSTLYSVTISE